MSIPVHFPEGFSQPRCTMGTNIRSEPGVAFPCHLSPGTGWGPGRLPVTLSKQAPTAFMTFMMSLSPSSPPLPAATGDLGSRTISENVQSLSETNANSLSYELRLQCRGQRDEAAAPEVNASRTGEGETWFPQGPRGRRRETQQKPLRFPPPMCFKRAFLKTTLFFTKIFLSVRYSPGQGVAHNETQRLR